MTLHSDIADDVMEKFGHVPQQAASSERERERAFFMFEAVCRFSFLFVIWLLSSGSNCIIWVQPLGCMRCIDMSGTVESMLILNVV